MIIKFNTAKHPDLEIDVLIQPKIFGLNTRLSIDNEMISPSNQKKHKYILSKNGTSYNIQITSTPYASKIIINEEKFD